MTRQDVGRRRGGGGCGGTPSPAFLLGLPALADSVPWRTARRLDAPVPVGDNAPSVWRRDALADPRPVSRTEPGRFADGILPDPFMARVYDRLAVSRARRRTRVVVRPRRRPARQAVPRPSPLRPHPVCPKG